MLTPRGWVTVATVTALVVLTVSTGNLLVTNGRLKAELTDARGAVQQCTQQRLTDAQTIYELEAINATGALAASQDAIAQQSGSFQSGYETGLALCGVGQ